MKLEVRKLFDEQARSIIDRSNYVTGKDGDLVFLMPEDYNTVLNNSALVRHLANKSKKNCIVYPDHQEISKKIFKTGAEL